MAVVKPFDALRFTEKAGSIDELVCPPYDIISEEERKNFLKQNEHNIIRLELPREGSDPYKTAGELMTEWINNDILKADSTASFYIYEIKFDLTKVDIADEDFAKKQRRILGLVGAVKLEEFEKGIVIPHEETLSKAKADRFNLMKATHCNFSNIYMLYKNRRREKALELDQYTTSAPIVSMTNSDGLVHTLWAVTDKSSISAIEKALDDEKLYIADGHHRYETGLNFRNYLVEIDKSTEKSGYIMATMVDINNPGLIVLPTHRIIHSLEHFDAHKILEKCKKWFDISNKMSVKRSQTEMDSLYKQEKHAFTLYVGDDFAYILVLNDDSVMREFLPDKSTASQNLDVTILHTLILENLMDIDKKNLENQINLTYTRSMGEAITSVDNGKAQCAFLLNATRVEEISNVAAENEKMPQKSTYFYPKLITGLTMNYLG